MKYHAERLEVRRLLSAQTFAETQALAATADRSVEGGFAVTVNFQPASVGSVANTRADFGRPFGPRGNGFVYGWNSDMEAGGRMADRNSDRDLFSLRGTPHVGNLEGAPDVDKRYDTLAVVEIGDRWSIEVPDDRTYAVALVVGDPDFGAPSGGLSRSDTAVNINGERFILAETKRFWPFGESVGYVEARDGRIDVEVVSGSISGRLLWVRVSEVEPLPQVAEGEAIAWRQISAGDAAAQGIINTPVPRAEGGEGRVGDSIVLIGGFEQRYVNTLRRVDLLDFATGQSRPGTPIPDGSPDTHGASAVDEERGLVFWLGGTEGNENNQDYEIIRDHAWAFDPNSGEGGTWIRLPDLPDRRSASSAFVAGGRVHLLGGVGDDAVLAVHDHWALDLTDVIDNANANAEWQIMPPLPFAVDHSRVEVVPGAAPAGGDLAVVVGGEFDHGRGYSTLHHVQRYDVDAASWTLGAPMPDAYSHHQTTVVDGRIFVIGGQGRANFPQPGVFSYDARSDRWLTHTPMLQARKIGVPLFDEANGRFLYLAGDTQNSGFVTDVLIGDITLSDDPFHDGELL